MNDTDQVALAKRSLEIFDNAVKLLQSLRPEYIREHCGTDQALLRNCYSLLEKDCSDESFFGDLLAQEPTKQEDECNLIGETFGIYQLNKKLGSGGMADVYSATRTDGVHSNPVALKLVRGWGDPKELVARFKRERKILSSLKHPNITYFLDGGLSEKGRPYYVMEYVEGEHFDQYCQRKNLPIHESLKLFIEVCEAVASAHQQLVIHRDLKPSNILVTEQGQVKLVDFGIAKIMDDEGLETSLSVLGIPMTLRYGSPEQVKRDTLTTASDQYSLGVLLFELLTGQSPYDLKRGDLLKAVCETQPKRPSQSNSQRRISRDLDAITLKALQKAPERRYSSVQQFAEDIQRYLTKRPVIAHEISVLYLATRFVQRNLMMVIVVLTLLSVGFGQQIRVMNERDVAERERELATKKGETSRQVQKFMVDLFEISDPGDSRGNSITAREILDRGVIKIKENLKEQPEEKSTLLHTMGAVYLNLGLYETSEILLKQSLLLRQNILPAGGIEEAESLNEYGKLKQMQGRYQEAITLHQQALAIYTNLPGEHDQHVAETYNNLGVVHQVKGEYEQAIEYYKKSSLINRKVLGKNHFRVGITFNNLGVVYRIKGEYDQAIEYYERALPILKKTKDENHPTVGSAYVNLGTVYFSKGDNDRAIEYIEQGLAIELNAFGENHPNVALTYGNLGTAYAAKGEYERAITYFEKELLIDINKLGKDHPSVANNYIDQGIVYQMKKEYERAIEYSEKATSILSSTVESNHPLYSEAYANLGDAYTALTKYSRALGYYKKAIAINIENLGANHPDTRKVVSSLVKLQELMKQTN